MTANVFISWSGERSHKLALALDQFLSDVIHRVVPWVSSKDIDKGTLWRGNLAETLRDLKVGILCLTTENLNAPWILFEAGALSKTLSDSLVVPFLLDLDLNQMSSPLRDFNCTKATKDDTFKLLQTLNGAIGEPVSTERLRRGFDKFWPDFEAAVQALAKEKPKDAKPAPPRSPEDILEDIVSRLGRLERRVVNHAPVEKTVLPFSIAELHRRLLSLDGKRASLVRRIEGTVDVPKKQRLHRLMEKIQLDILQVTDRLQREGAVITLDNEGRVVAITSR
jgi:hypothetical protein